MSIRARITQLKTIEPGEGVSYGHRYVAQRPTRVAVVGIGYADGVPRNLSNQMQVLIRGRSVPQIGSITMDQLMLDVTDFPGDLMPGEVVTLLGEDAGQQIRAEDWADRLGTISWEILCGFKHRLPRITVND
jgi:alanine racemase